MEFLPGSGSWALPLLAVLLLSLWFVRSRQRGIERRSQVIEHLDTVADWPPEAARVMTIDERHAYELLRRAMPGFMVLAQVPLARFVRVPMRRSYTEWMQRVGSLSADLVLCDAGSRVLAVVDIRPQDETARSQRRHERMARVLRAAGVHVSVWRAAHRVRCRAAAHFGQAGDVAADAADSGGRDGRSARRRRPPGR
jgi:Protein of unknown function (DUF2726)